MTYPRSYTETESTHQDNEPILASSPSRRADMASIFLEASREDWTDTNILFSSASVLPEQIATSRARQKIDPGIAALMLAVLNDAVSCIQKGAQARDRRTQILARQAEEWVESTESDHPFSFISICSVLGLTPGYLRLGLKKWRRNVPTNIARKVRYSVRPQPRIAQAA